MSGWGRLLAVWLSANAAGPLLLLVGNWLSERRRDR